jgi:hypothetical protein
VAKQVTETAPILQLVNPEPILKRILDNTIAFSKARTADEMHQLNNEHRRLNDQLYAIIDQREATI